MRVWIAIPKSFFVQKWIGRLKSLEKQRVEAARRWSKRPSNVRKGVQDAGKTPPQRTNKFPLLLEIRTNNSKIKTNNF